MHQSQYLYCQHIKFFDLIWYIHVHEFIPHFGRRTQLRLLRVATRYRRPVALEPYTLPPHARLFLPSRLPPTTRPLLLHDSSILHDYLRLDDSAMEIATGIAARPHELPRRLSSPRLAARGSRFCDQHMYRYNRCTPLRSLSVFSQNCTTVFIVRLLARCCCVQVDSQYTLATP
eukprot:COSAG02_NODE_2738_length_8128_cov_10.634201_3_plen_174_part_00